MSRSSASIPRAASDVGVTFGVLGPLEVLDTSGSPLQVPGRQERALLALLLTAPGRVFAVSAIVAGLWADEPPAGAEKTVQSYVSRLRRALPGGTSLVLTRSPGYLLAVDPARVDAERFRTSVSTGRRELSAGQAATAADHLREALALWRGEAYAEFDAPFAVAERIALEELRLTALEGRRLDAGRGSRTRGRA